MGGCGATEPTACPMPTAEQERAAFRSRAQELRAQGPDVTVDDGSAGLPRPRAGFEVRVTRAGVGIGGRGAIASWSDEELERQIAETDPMQLGLLLARPDPDVIVQLNEDGSLPPGAVERGGFLIPGLLSALRADPAFEDAGAVSLAVAPSTPFRTVAAVVYTVAQAGGADLDFLVRAPDGVHARRFALPSLDRGLAARAPLSVVVGARGVTVSGPQGPLAPGCEGPRGEPSELTIPSDSAAVDSAAMQRCLRRAVEGGANPATVILSADPSVAFEHYLRAAIAAGEVFETLLMSAGVM